MDETYAIRSTNRARRLGGPSAALVAALVLVAGCGGEAEEELGGAGTAVSETSSQAAASASSAAEPESEATETAVETSEREEETTEDTASATEEEPEAAAVMITITDFTFDVSGTVAPGSEVIVINEDSVGHTVTSEEEGLFDVAVGGGEEVTFTVPDEPGEYPFYCRPHPNMTSTLVVG